MPKAPMADVLAYVRTVAALQHGRNRSDSELLSSFISGKDDAAFSLLVQRHGPMVLAVCRRILGDAHLAEDAFQATFLVLARRAALIRKADSLIAWLHGVARRVAGRAKAQRHKAAMRDQADRGTAMSQKAPLDELTLDELRKVLDEEISALPQKYRLPILHCGLHGQSHEEAARALACPKGTLTSRLARARELLERRLSDRGISVPAGSLAIALAESNLRTTVGALLTINTVKAASAFAAGRAVVGSGISTLAVQLAEGAMKGTLGINLKAVLATLMLGLAIASAGLAGTGGSGTEPVDSSSPALAPQPPVLASQRPTKEAVIDYLNNNSARIPGIKSDDITLTWSAGGAIGVPLSATLRAQGPRNFRMTASALGQQEVDLGSNAKEFWYWFRHGDPFQVFCSYKAVEEGAVKHMPFPFQPDWIIEAMYMGKYGPAGKYELAHDDKHLKLIERTKSPQGKPVKRVVVMNRATSRNDQQPQITDFLLVDEATDKVICSAHVVQRQIIGKAPNSVQLPRELELEWPEQKIKLALKLDGIQLTGQIPEQVFERRPIKGVQSFNLATQRVEGVQPADEPGPTVPR